MNASAEANELGAAQRRGVAHPIAGGSLALRGPAGAGKTYALLQRAIALAAEVAPERILVTAPTDFGVARLQRELAHLGAPANVVATSFGATAFAFLREAQPHFGSLETIDDVRASMHFERAGAELFDLAWTELVAGEIDPEIPGLKTPERFAAAAFRLVRKLRGSLVSPEAFKAAGLRGAAAFYGAPPNFASSDLIIETPEKYRDSLRADPAELERQRTRETDLVKVLARLYERYLEELVGLGCLTPTDAVYEAVALVRERPELRETARRRYAAILVDDAQDLTLAQYALVEAIASDGLANVTLAGDDAQHTRGFTTGARGADNFSAIATSIVLDASERGETERAPQPGRVAFYRGDSVRDEAAYVAAEAARLVAGGTPPGRIAVVTRNLGCAHEFVNALLARGLPVDVAGDASLYEFPVVRDALAALWSAVDPYRHEYVLRALQAPWIALCDASIATLCGDAADPQPLLFEIEDGGEARSSRWDRRRDLRLGRNVTRGDVDTDLPAEARERIGAFRTARTRWDAAARRLEANDLARLVLDETVLATLPDDPRGRFERGLVLRLQRELDALAERDPLASLEEHLTYLERVASAEDDLLRVALHDEEAIRVTDVDAARGESFDAVFAVDVRAGAWPKYYAPDAFLFTKKIGMIPKENVGDASAARTAKFTYALFRFKFRERYNDQERRAFTTAMSRSRGFLSISVSGRATRGVSAPELFEETRKSLGR